MPSSVKLSVESSIYAPQKMLVIKILGRTVGTVFLDCDTSKDLEKWLTNLDISNTDDDLEIDASIWTEYIEKNK